MHCFVINLDRRPDRWQKMLAQLEKAQISYDRISAFDAKHNAFRCAVRPVSAWVYDGFSPTLPGAVGCFLSHQHIWKIMVERSIPQALILEDDEDFFDWDPAILELDIAALELDLLRIGARNYKGADIYINQVTRDPVQCSGLSVIGRQISFDQTAGTYACIVTLAGAQKMLACKKFWFSVDHFHMWWRWYQLRSGVLIPPLVRPGISASDVENSSRPRKKKWQLMMKRWVRHIISCGATTTG